jgi:hypothetical protein
MAIDRHGGVYLVCLHPQRLQRGFCNRKLLGYARLSLLNRSDVFEAANYLSPDRAGSGFVDPRCNPAGNAPQGPPIRKNSERSQRRTGPAWDPDPEAALEEEERPDDAEVPTAQHRRNLSREDCVKCVEIENQKTKNGSFRPWTVEVGPWGGRLAEPTEVDKQNSNELSGPPDVSTSTPGMDPGWKHQKPHRSCSTLQTPCFTRFRIS